MKHELDEEIEEYLETVLNIVAQASTLQYNEEARLAMLGLAETVARYFELEIEYVSEEEQELAKSIVDGGTVH